MILDEEWDMMKKLLDFLKVCLHPNMDLPYSQVAPLQMFRKASERMAGEKYPTLSFALATYVELLTGVARFKRLNRPTGEFAAALNACELKLAKYFTTSSNQSIYYYIATGKS